MQIKENWSEKFADSAYSICFLSRFGFRFVRPKIKISSKYFGEVVIKLKHKKSFIVILFFLVHSCNDYSLPVQLRDLTQITRGLSLLSQR